jgi:hypothetical protein
VVKVTDVPIGGYGVFPRGDLAQVFIKLWNNDGTTKVIKYLPAEEQETSKENEITQMLLSKISVLENKINAVLDNQSQAVESLTAQPQQVKEVKTYEY